LEKLLAEATPWPWVVDGPTENGESYDCYYVRAEARLPVAETDGWSWSGTPEDGRDARVIAALRNAAPTLLALARAGRGLHESAGRILSGVPHGEFLLDTEKDECDELSAAIVAWREADA